MPSIVVVIVYNRIMNLQVCIYRLVTKLLSCSTDLTLEFVVPTTFFLSMLIRQVIISIITKQVSLSGTEINGFVCSLCSCSGVVMVKCRALSKKKWTFKKTAISSNSLE